MCLFFTLQFAHFIVVTPFTLHYTIARHQSRGGKWGVTMTDFQLIQSVLLAALAAPLQVLHVILRLVDLAVLIWLEMKRYECVCSSANNYD